MRPRIKFGHSTNSDVSTATKIADSLSGTNTTIRPPWASKLYYYWVSAQYPGGQSDLGGPGSGYAGPVTDGQIFIVYNDFSSNTSGMISEYTTAGVLMNPSLVSGLPYPVAIAASGSDLFVATSNGTIGEYTTADATVNASLISGLSDPSGIAISGSDLFVTENIFGGTAIIGEYTTSGATVNASLVSGLSSPLGRDCPVWLGPVCRESWNRLC